MASVIGGKDHGVAEGVTLGMVKFYQNGKANTGTFMKAMQQTIEKHKTRRHAVGFNGSIIDMCFKMSKTPGTERVLEEAYNAGIQLVASA